MRYLLLVCLVTVGVTGSGAGPGQAQEASVPATTTTPAPVDTVRTNLWLMQALMAEVVRATLPALPTAPASINLQQEQEDAANDLFGIVASAVLTDEGFELYLDTATTADDAASDSTGAVIPAGDYEYRFKVDQAQLGYPAVGRTLGLWRQWVARQFQVVAQITVVKRDTGLLLLNERIERRFEDRVPTKVFDAVRSDAYPFTDSQIKGSGWGRRMEEILVLGTLTGLVIIYFANTGS